MAQYFVYTGSVLCYKRAIAAHKKTNYPDEKTVVDHMLTIALHRLGAGQKTGLAAKTALLPGGGHRATPGHD
jgi:hypothetical protein